MPAVLYMHKQFSRAVHLLTDEEQSAVKGTISDYLGNPKLPGLHWHRLERGRDRDFASIRSSRDIRLILHPCLDGEILCYVDHHDAAYSWAENRTLKFDSDSEDVQLYEWPVAKTGHIVREKANRKLPLFRNYGDDDLKWYGVPEEWLETVREITDGDEILDLVGSLPERACESLMTLAEGARPPVNRQGRRDVVRIEDAAQVERFLDMSWDEWLVYLHPSQEDIVTDDAPGDFLVTGGAGTGKTVVALHRAAQLSRSCTSGKVALLTTSVALASRLRQQIKWLDANIDRCIIATLMEVARAYLPEPRHVIPRSELDELIRQTAEEVFPEETYGLDELRDEYCEYWDTQHLGRDEYLVANRSGMTFRLNRRQRGEMYRFMERLAGTLEELSYMTETEYFHHVAAGNLQNDFAEIIVDECQNLGKSEWDFVFALKSQSAKNSARLALFGDVDQRITGHGIPKGVRTFQLHVDYRSSARIKQRASVLVGHRTNVGQSMFKGVAPVLHEAVDEEQERAYVSGTLKDILSVNPFLRYSDMAFFVHDASLIQRAEMILEAADIPYVSFYDGAEFGERELNAITIATFNQAPGLEFRVVFVIGCEYGVVPPRDVVNSEYEKRLLYVVMTRARDALVITGVPILSEFLAETRSLGHGDDENLGTYLSRQQIVHRPSACLPKDAIPPAIPSASSGDRPMSNSAIARKHMVALYHMASVGNIQSLLQRGLLSKNEVARLGISVCDISNQDVQLRRERKCDPHYGRNLHDYASLYINPRNAMLYTVQLHIGSIFILEIDLAVLDETSFVFTNANAASSHARFYKDLNGLDDLNWDIINSKGWKDRDAFWKQQMQAEFLVHPRVLARHISAVLCPSEQSAKEIRGVIGSQVPVRCERKLFF